MQSLLTITMQIGKLGRIGCARQAVDAVKARKTKNCDADTWKNIAENNKNEPRGIVRVGVCLLERDEGMRWDLGLWNGIK